jgi:GNAT superfamily N-acetyltransferase
VRRDQEGGLRSNPASGDQRTADDPKPYVIGLASADEVAALPGIEARACSLFDTVPATASLPEYPTPIDDFIEAQRQGLLWVARLPGAGPVGFALAERLGDDLHLEELDVLPEHGRRGIGTALLRTVRAQAASERRRLTLTTFKDVPWNRPFYERLGFHVLDDDALTPGLAERVEEETAAGLPRALRVVMALEAPPR